MRANFPPFTRSSAPAPAQPEISDRESKLRTLKHYLYHAGLLVDELIAAESHVAPQFSVWGVSSDGVPVRLDADRAAPESADFTRDRDATGA